MENLTNALTQFEAKAKVVSNETELQNIFKELAPAFLYGGYIKVREDYQVYIRTVEFYFHSEKIQEYMTLSYTIAIGKI